MRILTDETVAGLTIKMLRDLGHDVLDVREAGLGGATDESVSALASEQHRVIITHDRHFGDLLVRRAIHRGAIILRLKHTAPSATNAALSVFLSGVDDDYPTDRIVILSERGFRSRKVG